MAVPLISYVTEKDCLYLKENKCGICLAVCPNQAIDFSQKPEEINLKVGAIVLSPGFEIFDPSIRNDFGYGIYPNVVTSLDFERITSATGPYGGEIRRPSDMKHPKKIAWIQCVGSRRVIEGYSSYCSSVCCTYTQKQVLITKEHDPDTEIWIFHNDIRAYGKDFERYYQRAAQLDKVKFIRSYVTVAGEDSERNVIIRYSTPDEGVKEEKFDLVVLSVGLRPPSEAKELAEKFGIELNEHGFCKVSPFDPLQTSRPGIFVSGAFQGPVDIPESVFSASGVSSKCGELLSHRRGLLAKEKVYPEEMDVSKEEPRIGVFVCHCGSNIAGVINTVEMAEYAKTLPNVVYATNQVFSCASNYIKEIIDAIHEHKLNRVVIAACTPRNLEPTFRETMKEAGLNQYYLEMVNIREHCTWAHSKEREEATRKVKDLIRMAVARAARLEPLKEIEIPLDKRILVIGGGVAGMTSALSLANQGFEVYLVEKEKELGGIAKRLYFTIDGQDVQSYLKGLIEKVYAHPLIHVFTEAKIKDASGYIGNFITTVETGNVVRIIRHGATIIATGAEEYKPKEYLYGEDERVFTHLELEELIAKKDERIQNARSVVMIQCVGSRNEERNYCSRVCCSHAIKNAIKLKEINPQAEIYILFRDMRTYGFREDYYRKASDMGVRFIRYEPPENVPEVEKVEGRLRVTVTDPILGQRIAIDADILSLAAAVVPREDAKRLAQLYKVPLDVDGFFKEAHVKLRPVDFATDGIFLCGTAHYPKHINETISQAYGAAGRCSMLLSHDVAIAPGAVAQVDEKRCMGCGICASFCKYGAIEIKKNKAKVNPVLCKGDGLCNSVCPTGAISLNHFKNEQILCQIDALLSET